MELRLRGGQSGVERGILGLERVVQARQHLFSHQFHRAAAERFIGPIHAGIGQRPEGADLFPERQYLVNDAVDSAGNDLHVQ